MKAAEESVEPAYSADDFRRNGEAWGGAEWQRPLARALVSAGLLNGAHADVTVRRYASGARGVPDAIRDWLTAQATDRDIWARGLTDRGLPIVVHLAAPRFIAIYHAGAIRTLDWIDAKPGARVQGKLLAEAAHRARG